MVISVTDGHRQFLYRIPWSSVVYGILVRNVTACQNVRMSKFVLGRCAKSIVARDAFRLGDAGVRRVASISIGVWSGWDGDWGREERGGGIMDW